MSHEFLQILWFILIAVLWAGYLVLEGFDFGVGMLLRWLPNNAKERRLMLNSIGPHWDGNEVWLLTAGGATFAAFPEWYATMFSGFYLALFVILVVLILRIVAIEWRGKISDVVWTERWDWIHTVSAWVATFLWGVAFANLVQGVRMEVVARGTWEAIPPAEITQGTLANAVHVMPGGFSGFFSLLTPYTILGGLVTCALFLTHGAIFLALKTEGDLQQRAIALSKKASIASLVIAGVFAVIAQLVYGGHWLGWIGLVVAAVALVGVVLATHAEREGWAFIGNAVAAIFAVVLIFSTMYPNALKSSIDPAYNLTIWDASSSEKTLPVMTIVALTLVPVVLAYIAWSYWIFRKRLTVDHIPDENAGLPMSFLSN
ncbi:cytochrome d ubiquinol oxidase subunit II [Bowdeniella nasicola]|uniref:Cytochrome d ubiquinol oxidase subunit II n=1 Tax=Bowdeniella nasicola TaxID=208480 RepID=A0A1H4C177_9ACTO|nr:MULTISPECIES: cytochrome d ubiquinol oxidase subunit II [Bowdeniella]SEA54148.1 cytochrome d ubiquinol oxidase subunit II [Bowdeniella nasicola]